MKEKNYEELAKTILENVGGSDNVRTLHHCATRLRFNVLDKGLINEEVVKKIPGVLGTKWLGNQFQVIIGADVKLVFNELGDMNVASSDDAPIKVKSEKFSLKGLGSSILAYLSSSMSMLIPIMIGTGMCRTLAIVLGPDLLNVISASSEFYALMNMIQNTLMFFLPVLLGYTACKSLDINPLFGMFLGALLVAPDFRAMIGVQDTMKVYFMNAPVMDYGSAFLPIILACPILKYVMKFFEKFVPKAVSMILVPLCTLLVMVFVMFVVCGPLGSYLGTAFGMLFSNLNDGNIFIRIIGAAALCVSWPFLILFGMHMPVVQLSIISLITVGYDTIIWPTAIGYNFVMIGIGLGAFLKIKDKEEKGTALSAFITSFFGGITEPTMYGIVMRYKNGIIALIAGCATSGLLFGIFAPKIYALAGQIITLPIIFAGGGSTNLITGTAILLAGLAVGVVCAYFLIDYNKPATEVAEEA